MARIGQRAGNNNTLPLTKQIRQDTRVVHHKIVAEIGDRERHLQRICGAVQSTPPDHTTGPQRLPQRSVTGRNLLWGLEEVHIGAQCVHQQPSGYRCQRHDAHHYEQPLAANRIHVRPSPCAFSTA